MNNTKREYQKRLNEVELYFGAIELLDKGECFINCPYKNSECMETCLEVLKKLILEVINDRK